MAVAARADHLAPLDAIVRVVDPRFRCAAVSDDDGGWSSRSCGVTPPRPEPDDVLLTKFSTGAAFAFEDRGTPVVLRTGPTAPATGARPG